MPTGFRVNLTQNLSTPAGPSRDGAALGVAGKRANWASSHSWQRTYGISTGTGSLELSVILFSPEKFTSNATSETETPSEHDAITFTSEPFSWNDLTVHF